MDSDAVALNVRERHHKFLVFLIKHVITIFAT